MLKDFMIVAGQVLTLFLMMAVGFFLTSRGKLTSDTLSQLSHLLLYIVAPCVVIDSLLSAERTPELLWSILYCLAALVVTYAIYMLLAMLLFKKKPADTRATLRFAVVYGNAGFMGLPLVQAILGNEALIYCTVSLAVFNIASWTHGAVLMGGRENASIKKAIINPGVIGCVIGFLLFFTAVKLPGPVSSTIKYMGSLNTPLAMIVIGGQMALSNLPETFRRPDLYGVSAVKLVVFPLITALVLLPFGLSSDAYCTLVILSACPTAGVTGMFAQTFKRDTGSAAQQVTLSTLLSIITLPVFALLARILCG